MKHIRVQLKRRRKGLGLKQEDMMLRVGMSRQQYQRLESRGNPRLDTLELVARGLKMEVMLIPQEKLRAVRELLNNGADTITDHGVTGTRDVEAPAYFGDDPWRDLLETGDD